MSENAGTAIEQDEEAARLGAAIQVLVRRFGVGERADQACCGMTVAQAAALRVLDHEGPIRLGDLGRRLGIAPSTLSRNFATLEARGWVVRDTDPSDARAQRARLTPAGCIAARDVLDRERAFVRRILDRIPDTKRQRVVAAVDVLLEAVREATESCCPGAFDHLMKIRPCENAGDSGRPA
jgi:DNA-binding MarR family transcriptional regulator